MAASMAMQPSAVCCAA